MWANKYFHIKSKEAQSDFIGFIRTIDISMFTMMIPALDAVRSQRFGYLSTERADMAIVLYDKKVGNRNHGEDWQIPKPVFLRTHEPTDLVTIVENAESVEKNNFSQGFWEQVAKIYRVLSPEYSEDGSDTEVQPQNAENQFETQFVNNIIHTVNNYGPSHELWESVLSDAQWNRIQDAETGDVSIFSEDERTFKESVFTNVDYIPSIDEVQGWGLYSYSWRHEGKEVDSLWVRIQGDNGNIKEFPLVENLNGLGSIVSTNPDFGGIESNHISRPLQQCLTSSTVGGETQMEEDLSQAVKSASLSDKTRQYVSRAVDSSTVENS